MTEPNDKSAAREEFLAEAQEIIEGLSRDLLLVDQGVKAGKVDPDLINEVFRGVHTLKGVAGMFGYHKLGTVAHALEDLLDALRLGKVLLDQEVLDVLFEGLENFQRLIAAPTDSSGDVALDDYAASIESVNRTSAASGDVLDDFELDDSVLSVLTEYEEHRLRTNVEQGVALYKLEVSFSLTTIDSALEDLKARAKPVAEIITYLPSMGGGDSDTIDLEVLMASRVSAEELRRVLGEDLVLRTINRRESAAYRAGSPSSDTLATPLPPMREEHRATPIPAPPKPAANMAAPADVGADSLSLRSITNTVRVDIRKLDHLMNVVGELSLVRSALLRTSENLRSRPEMRQVAAELHRIQRAFERRLEELQDGILDVRMVPLGQVFDKLARIVRGVARESGKEVRLVISGGETEVDKLIVEELSDPLMHIIRNAIDHGIESPKVREIAEKQTQGTLALHAYQKGSHVLIDIEDDGQGMNPEALIRTAVARGLMSESDARDISRDEAFALIFHPGFTTRSRITDISGRGMGMDVVKTNISRLGGIIDVESVVGEGTKFTITLPVTMAIISALLFRVCGRSFALPVTSVQEAIVLDPAAVRTVEGREVLSLRGATLPLCRLRRLFGFDTAEQGSERRFVIVSALGHRRLGFVVDSLEGQQDVVIKPLGPSLASVRGFAGATDIGDQRVALVLDAPGLLEEMLSGSERAASMVGGAS